jgi:hypothetical protein
LSAQSVSASRRCDLIATHQALQYVDDGALNACIDLVTKGFLNEAYQNFQLTRLIIDLALHGDESLFKRLIFLLKSRDGPRFQSSANH